MKINTSCLCGPAVRQEEDKDVRLPLLIAQPQKNCRQSRPEDWQNQRRKTKVILSLLLRFSFWSSGYNKRLTYLSWLYSCYLFMICWYQVVYEVSKIVGCPEFTCSENLTIHSTRELEYISYLAASIGSACSYTFMLLCLNIVYKQHSNSISPYVGLKDMANSKAKIILVTVITSSSIFVMYVLMFVYQMLTEVQYSDKSRQALYLFSLICEFIAEWVGIVSLYAFACSSFAIGRYIC